jgi:ribonuclease D
MTIDVGALEEFAERLAWVLDKQGKSEGILHTFDHLTMTIRYRDYENGWHISNVYGYSIDSTTTVERTKLLTSGRRTKKSKTCASCRFISKCGRRRSR